MSCSFSNDACFTNLQPLNKAHVLEMHVFVRHPLVLRATPSHVYIPPPPQMKRESVLGKIQHSERYSEVAFVFRRAARLCEQNLPLAA